MLSEPDRIDENLGTDYLGIPGTNGTDRLDGGWPQFDVTNYSDIGYAGSANRPTSTTTGRCSTRRTRRGRAGAHTFKFGGDIVPSGAEPLRARQRVGQFQLRRRPDRALGRRIGESVQHLRLVPARACRPACRRASFRSRTAHAKPELAVQLVREGSVAASQQAHGVDWLALGLLPDGHAHDARHGALRHRHQPDADMRRWLGADRLRLRHGAGKLLSAARPRLSA